MNAKLDIQRSRHLVRVLTLWFAWCAGGVLAIWWFSHLFDVPFRANMVVLGWTLVVTAALFRARKRPHSET